jgi:PKD repeat protein
MIQMNKRNTNHCRFTGGSLITMASLAFALLMTMAQQALALNVAIMPSNSQNPAKGLAQQNVAIEVWGRAWDNNGGITSATLDFGDGSPVANLGIGNPSDYLGTTHTYASFGVKTVTLSVTDSDGTVTKTAKIKVLQAPTPEERINMAIEKGLLYMYKSKSNYDANRIYWYHASAYYGQGVTGSVLLAFEENGHLPGNNYSDDIYAEMVQKGLNTLLSISAGTNANGAYIFNGNNHGTYANAFASMAFFVSQPDAATAQATTINNPNSPFNGQTYWAVGQEVLRAFQTNQGSNGAWYYPTTYASKALGGSTQQWPVLALITAQQRWGIQPSQVVIDRAFSAFQALQNGNGAIGYRSNTQWLNSSKTGGILVAAALKGVTPGAGDDALNNSVDRAIQYLGNVWNGSVSNGDNNGPVGQMYAMYGVKKGFALLEVETINTVLGLRDWYKDQSSYLLGDPNLWAPDGYSLHPNIGSNGRSTSYAFGTHSNGAWTSSTWPNYGIDFTTAHAVLVLTQAVTIPLPVAIIATIGDAGEVKANEDFDLDGTQSYHQDGDLAIVSYSWEINAVGGANNPVATASGATPTIGGLNPGEYQAILTVTDNNPEEAQTSSDTSTFFSVNKNFGPQSVPIPSGQIAYTAQVTQGGSVTITLDGSESSDPEGDPIVSYNWDLDADGDYDDATGVNPTMTLTSPGSVTIALEVCSENSYVDALGNTITETQCSTDNAPVLVIYSESDLSVTAISAANIVQGVSADLSATVANDATSGQAFTGVKVRFFDGDPDAGGLALAPAQSVDLPIGGSATVVESGLGLNAATELVWVKVDWAQGVATGDVDEWDEGNNTASVNVSNQPPVVEWIPQGTAPAFSVGADCLAAIDASVFYSNASDPDGDQLTITVNPAGPLGLGAHTVTVTVSDGQESLSEDYSITVVDTTDPVLSVPAGVTLECPADTSVAANGTATATDNCSVTVTFVDVVTAACGSTQTIARTWTATDGAGNSVSGLQVIEVVDTTNPVLVGVLADETVECDSVPAPADVTATDNCDAPSVVFDEVRTDGDCPSNYTLTRTWVATDACGNSSSATQVITVQDTTAPAPIAIDLRDITNKETPITFTATSSDNCGGVVVTITNVTRHKFTKKGKIVFLDEKSGSKPGSGSKSKSGSGSKSKSLPAIVIDGSSFTVNESGPAGTIITVYATAVDECGNSTDGEFTATVVKPPKSNSKSSKSKKSAANEGVGNGVDGNTPGHDNNGGNDDPGNTPGNPGAKEKSESSGSEE